MKQFVSVMMSAGMRKFGLTCILESYIHCRHQWMWPNVELSQLPTSSGLKTGSIKNSKNLPSSRVNSRPQTSQSTQFHLYMYTAKRHCYAAFDTLQTTQYDPSEYLSETPHLQYRSNATLYSASSTSSTA